MSSEAFVNDLVCKAIRAVDRRLQERKEHRLAVSDLTAAYQEMEQAGDWDAASRRRWRSQHIEADVDAPRLQSAAGDPSRRWREAVRHASDALCEAGKSVVASDLRKTSEPCPHALDEPRWWRAEAYQLARARQILRQLTAEPAGGGAAADQPEGASKAASPKGTKKSTERGEAQAKLIAALTQHHRYADGGCLSFEPVGCNELSRRAGVSQSTAAAFFDRQFGGHTKYRAICSDATRLITALRLLNQEISPLHLFGTTPPGEGERDDEG